MRKHSKKWAFLRWYLPIVLVVLLCISAALWLTMTSEGVHWLFHHAQRMWPEMIRGGTVSGRLVDTVTVRQLDLHINGVEIKSDHIILTWEPKALWKGQIQIKQLDIKSMRVRVGKDYRVTIHSQLQLWRNLLGVWFVRGDVQIPAAELTPTKLESSSELPAEVVFVDEPAKKPRKPLLVDVDINLRLGQQVKIKAWGLEGFLRGELRIQKKARGIASATGTLRLEEGKYQAYGQVLEIQRGELLYADSPLDNPGLNVQAGRKISARNITEEDIEVGVRVQGQLQEPKVELFSVPPTLSDADKLGYLVLGYPMSQGSADGTSYEKLSFSLGKKLSPGLYLAYTMGVTDPIGTLILQYKLGKNWLLQGEASSQGNGLDVLYHWEKE